MRENPQTHAGLTLPDEIWVLLDQLADAGVGGVDEGIAVGARGRTDEDRLWRLETWFSVAPQRKWLRFAKGVAARTRAQWVIYDKLLAALRAQEETLTLDDLVEMFSFPSWDDVLDRLESGHRPCDHIADDEEREECEEESARAAYSEWRSGVAQIAESLFRQHSLDLRDTPDEWRFQISSSYLARAGEPDWETAARALIHTINGMGPDRLATVEDFVGMGPFSGLREAVLRNLSSVADWPRVYSGTTARRMFEDYLR